MKRRVPNDQKAFAKYETAE